MSAADRALRTAAADARARAAYLGQGGPESGAALVAVGGYGRGDLAPRSDLDLVLVYEDVSTEGAAGAAGSGGPDSEEFAQALWYPLWDSGVRVDHAVRGWEETLVAARSDLKVALGLLDARHVAGDPGLTLRLRSTLLAEWRRDARERLGPLAELVAARHARSGELAHAAVPDLKEAEGGLRDTTVLQALVATWLVDVPHQELVRSRDALLDVRDHLHEITGRASDRIPPEAWEPLAERLGLSGAGAAQRHVRELGRRVTHVSRLTWRRAQAVRRRPSGRPRPRRPQLTPLARGVALSRGEVVLNAKARPARDPLLMLRAAAEASERDVVLAPATAARLAREGADLPVPWPAEARSLLVRLLAGPGLVDVWETLDVTGALPRILPEWERVRLLPHASAIHRFTVDRHMLETCREASALMRSQSRPDVLMVAALLHDIGKGGLVEHSVAGEPVAREIATRMGFDADAVELIARLVRRHLLLGSVATSRDPDDPLTCQYVIERLGDPATAAETLDLLVALTKADARATSPAAWTRWRASLVNLLASRCRQLLTRDAAAPPQPDWLPVPRTLIEDPGAVDIVIEPLDDSAEQAVGLAGAAGPTGWGLDTYGGATVRVIAPDRIGLMADVAAALAWQRVSVRAARAWPQDDLGCSRWQVADAHLDPALLSQRLEAIADRRLDPTRRLGTCRDPRASVAIRPEASDRATVLEVRTADRPGVLWLVLSTVAALGIDVRSAHVDTLGPQAVDVFYLAEEGAGALSEQRASEAAHAVRAALTGQPAAVRGN